MEDPRVAAPARSSIWIVERLPAERAQQCQALLSYGSIHIVEGAADWKWVEVRTYQTAWVALKFERESLRYQCGCDAFKKIAPEPCEHVAAAVVYYEEISGGRVARSEWGAFGKPPAKRLSKLPIGAISEDVKAYLVQDAHGKAVKPVLQPSPPIWKPYLQALRRTAHETPVTSARAWPAGSELIYTVNAEESMDARAVVVETLTREPKKTGGWKVAKAIGLNPEDLPHLPEADVEPATRLLAATSYTNAYSYHDRSTRKKLTTLQANQLLPAICASGRCSLKVGERREEARLVPLAWDETRWDLSLDIERDETRKHYVVTGSLRRGEEVMPLSKPLLLLAGGFVFWQPTLAGAAHAAPLNDHGAFEWIDMLRKKQWIRVPFDAGDELLAELYRFKKLPRPNLPDELRVEEIVVAPKPRVMIRPAPPKKAHEYVPDERLVVDLAFDYGGTIVSRAEVGSGIFSKEGRRVVRRDFAAEQVAISKLSALGVRLEHNYSSDTPRLRLAPKAMPQAVRTLLADEWHVEAEGKLYRQPGELKFDVSSGIDWFDLTVTADFGGVSAPLPRLLAALRKGESVVQLDDGTFGVLPESWLKKYAPLANVAKSEGDSLRFTRTQAGLLDALLAAQPHATFDDSFGKVREELHSFGGVRPMEPPASFIGELRPYQRDSLGWFDFLRRFGFGGCLADDMGLGKTVQVLALLEQRRVDKVGRPTLVVVPRSLIFNWSQEAAKFAPKLRVLDHSQASRVRGADHFSDYDLILTTYGTLLRDALYMKDTAFDYVILDEAQAVKNPTAESSKAVRLLQGSHRLVLSGTPVQNHLGDLWSLFEFLNPGMLGSAALFTGAASKTPEAETRDMLARGLRPFILRRTKEQVAQDLPPRQEQTIYCEMEAEQRKLYDELRDHYRQSLLGLIDTQGVNRSKIQILEALLRLRQAACHPALIDKAYAKKPSAKLDALIPQIQEVLEGGHKVLIFSQFTTFLGLVKAQLKAAGLAFEYLDGKTRDRQARVDHFQTDPDCKIFLISLKAGGVGLNLTAADYCFLLDPWWNPAVEAQAIDRAHRIGQTRHVFARRLIAKDTVEEKVLALQESKKSLADAIVNADNALIRTIGREDLELLLS